MYACHVGGGGIVGMWVDRFSSNERIEGPFELPGEPIDSHTNYPPTTDMTGIHTTGNQKYQGVRTMKQTIKWSYDERLMLRNDVQEEDHIERMFRRIEGPFELPGEPIDSHTNYPPTTDMTGIHTTGKLRYLYACHVGGGGIVGMWVDRFSR
jgi:hypothetical protein